MKIYTLETGPILTNAYLVADEESRKAVIIDAPIDCYDSLQRIITDFSYSVEFILLTHSHWDHSGEAHLLNTKLKAPIAIHPDDEFRLLDPNSHSIMALPFKLLPAKPALYLEDGQAIEFGEIKIEVMHTPGHTEGSVCFYIEEEEVLFSGDTLFKESIGRVDLPGGSMDKIIISIKEKLMELPDEVKVFPGHGPTTTIEDEKLINPFIIDND